LDYCLYQISEEGESQKELSDPIITTGFIEWCARQLAEPAAGGSDDVQSQAKPDQAPDLTEFEVFPKFFFLISVHFVR